MCGHKEAPETLNMGNERREPGMVRALPNVAGVPVDTLGVPVRLMNDGTVLVDWYFTIPGEATPLMMLPSEIKPVLMAE